MRNYFSNILKIKRNPEGTKRPNGGSCFGGNYEAFDAPNADLVVFVRGYSEPGSGYLALAGACSLDSGSLRPNIGHIDYNIDYLKTNPAEFPAS